MPLVLMAGSTVRGLLSAGLSLPQDFSLPLAKCYMSMLVGRARVLDTVTGRLVRLMAEVVVTAAEDLAAVRPMFARLLIT